MHSLLSIHERETRLGKYSESLGDCVKVLSSGIVICRLLVAIHRYRLIRFNRRRVPDKSETDVISIPVGTNRDFTNSDRLNLS